MTFCIMQIYQTVEDGFFMSASARQHILKKQNGRHGIYRAKYQNKVTINFPR